MNEAVRKTAVAFDTERDSFSYGWAVAGGERWLHVLGFIELHTTALLFLGLSFAVTSQT